MCVWPFKIGIFIHAIKIKSKIIHWCPSAQRKWRVPIKQTVILWYFSSIKSSQSKTLSRTHCWPSHTTWTRVASPWIHRCLMEKSWRSQLMSSTNGTSLNSTPQKVSSSRVSIWESWKNNYVVKRNVTQYNKRYILSTFEKIEMFALSYRRFNKLSNDTKVIKIEVILLKIQVLQSTKFLLFSLYFAHCFAHYLRINLADKMSLLL